MTQVSRVGKRRGQPLAMLGVVILGWIGLRAALWEQIQLPGLPPPVATAVARVLPSIVAKVEPRGASPLAVAAPAPAPAVAAAPFALTPLPRAPLSAASEPVPEFGPVAGADASTRVAAAHQLAWMAGVAQLPMPRFILDRMTATAERSAALLPAEARQARLAHPAAGRWSADAWLLLRSGGVGVTAAGIPSASYGASQAGAVIHYRLSPTSKYQPALFLRASSAVQAPHGEALALGIAARPLTALPVALQAELRVSAQAAGNRFRPAITVVTELPRLSLQTGLTAEAYGQAGYVAGTDATAFVDGQLRIEQRLVRIDRGELRVGLGGWGGAQKGASRLDVGPTASLDFSVARAQGRLSADWRLRAAGNAAPQSGPAITLSAGF